MPSKDPKANCLYRYIRAWKWFGLTLKRGVFVPRFCEEDFSWMEEGRPRCVILPMVSFCDIPLSNSRSHRKAYGDYVIGLKKSWGEKCGLNPLLYVSKGSALAHKLAANFNRPISRTLPLSADFGKFWPMLPYLKPVDGFQKDAQGRSELKFFEQEMEWRFVPTCWESLLESRRLDDRTQSAKEAQNAKVSGVKLAFSEADIDIVIVKTRTQRKILHAMRPRLRGKVKLWSEI
jgi:hypothetical protein